MKKRLTKIWSVGLIVMVLAGLLMVAAPVYAGDPEQWNGEPLIGADYGLNPGSDVYDFALGSDGTTVFAVGPDAVDNCSIWKSTNAGRAWIDITGNPGFPTSGYIKFVAIAPDSDAIVAVAGTDDNNTNPWVYVSTDAGDHWAVLPTIEVTSTGGSGDAAVNITSLAISSAVPPPTTRYVTVTGTYGATNNPAIFYYNLGGTGAIWKNAVNDFALLEPGGTNLTIGTIDTFLDIAFSPNFSADYTAVAVSSDGDSLQLHSLSFNLHNWDSFSGYPVEVAGAGAGDTDVDAAAAAIALAPDYVGNDDVSRVSFIAYGVDNTHGAVYRLDDNTRHLMKTGVGFYSADYNGTNLVLGCYASNIVYRCADPLSNDPTVSPSRTNKRIGYTSGNDMVVVKWNGDEVLGAKRGVQSAFSVSADNGMSWNDVSLIDTALTTISDLLIATDSSKIYFVSDDGAYTSVFRADGPAWQRILTLNGGNDYILRSAPDNNDAVWVMEQGAKAIYYSTDAGQTRWYAYNSAGNVTDAAAESKDVLYVASGKSVMKSTNAGFTWGPGVIPELGGEDVATIKCLGVNKLIVGGAGPPGFVSWSTDGNATWVKLVKPAGGAATQVIASGLDTGDFIYASGTNLDTVYRWTVGDTPAMDWKDLHAGMTGGGAYGIALVNGVLYVSTCNTTDTEVVRCLEPNIPGGWVWSYLPAAGAEGDLTPSALKVSMDGTNTKLWFVNKLGADSPPSKVLSWIDSLAANGPTPVTPIANFQDPMNAVSGYAQDITFNWGQPSVNASDYELELYLDQAGLNKITDFYKFSPGPTATLLIGRDLGDNAFDWTPGNTYYWRVRVDGVGVAGPTDYANTYYSAWSEMRSITVQPGQAMVPNIGSPSNGATGVSTSPAFSWSPVTGCTKYAFQLSADATFTTLITDATLPTTGIKPAEPLEAGMTYFWRVRSLEPVLGDWSTIANFTVAEPAKAPAPPVVVTQVPAPTINIPAAPQPTQIVIPQPEPAPQIAPAYIWAIIIIGAILVIAVIVLVIRTRRTV
jgi:hypothetical protein